MRLSKKQVLDLANLAKLKLTDKEVELYQEQLKDILVYVNKINNLDLSKVKESLTGVEDSKLGPRPDKVETANAGVEQACYTEDDYVVAPGVFNNQE